MAGRPVVIADAGPLIALSRISKLSILKDLFGDIWITAEIRDEVLPVQNFPGTAEIAEAIRAGWIHIDATEGNRRPPTNPGVDVGEASALALAEDLVGSLVIMDDRAGRAEAKSRGLQVIGTAAVVGLAREQNLIDSAKETLGELTKAGYFIPTEVIEAIAHRLDK